MSYRTNRRTRKPFKVGIPESAGGLAPSNNLYTALFRKRKGGKVYQEYVRASSESEAERKIRERGAKGDISLSLTTFARREYIGD